MAPLANIMGQRFGRLTVLSRDGKAAHGQMARWNCRCDCGSRKSVIGKHLRSGATKSCGCLQSDTVKSLMTTHGLYKAPEYQVWCSMKGRCYRKKDKRYADYGGRGIIVCDKWKESFQNFIEDMGPRPSSDHQIDRIDNDGPYCASNCRWATREIQARNRRNVYSDHESKIIRDALAAGQSISKVAALVGRTESAIYAYRSRWRLSIENCETVAEGDDIARVLA